MILKCPDFSNELEWKENKICELIIEHPQTFRNIVKDLYFHADDGTGISLTEKGEAIKFADQVDVIINPVKLDFGNRKVVTNLFKILVETSLSENYYLKTNDLKTKIVRYLDSVIDSRDFRFEVEADDFSLDKIAKAINFHVVEDEDDFIELLTNYLEMMRELAKTKLFVFVALRSFITTEELERLNQNVLNRDINILLLEDQTRDKITDIPRLTIDEDLCEF